MRASIARLFVLRSLSLRHLASFSVNRKNQSMRWTAASLVERQTLNDVQLKKNTERASVTIESAALAARRTSGAPRPDVADRERRSAGEPPRGGQRVGRREDGVRPIGRGLGLASGHGDADEPDAAADAARLLVLQEVTRAAPPSEHQAPEGALEQRAHGDGAGPAAAVPAAHGRHEPHTGHHRVGREHGGRRVLHEPAAHSAARRVHRLAPVGREQSAAQELRRQAAESRPVERVAAERRRGRGLQLDARGDDHRGHHEGDWHEAGAESRDPAPGDRLPAQRLAERGRLPEDGPAQPGSARQQEAGQEHSQDIEQRLAEPQSQRLARRAADRGARRRAQDADHDAAEAAARAQDAGPADRRPAAKPVERHVVVAEEHLHAEPVRRRRMRLVRHHDFHAGAH